MKIVSSSLLDFNLIFEILSIQIVKDIVRAQFHLFYEYSCLDVLLQLLSRLANKPNDEQSYAVQLLLMRNSALHLRILLESLSNPHKLNNSGFKYDKRIQKSRDSKFNIPFGGGEINGATEDTVYARICNQITHIRKCNTSLKTSDVVRIGFEVLTCLKISRDNSLMKKIPYYDDPNPTSDIWIDIDSYLNRFDARLQSVL